MIDDIGYNADKAKAAATAIAEYTADTMQRELKLEPAEIEILAAAHTLLKEKSVKSSCTLWADQA